MLTLNLFDSEFPDQPSCIYGKTPARVRYVRERKAFDGITVFTDRQMYAPQVEQVQSRYKFGWLVDGRELRPWYYENIGEVVDRFDRVMTCDADLLAGRPDKFIPTVYGGIWTPRTEWALYPKTKNVSLLLSEKTQLSGHRLRHQIADRYPGLYLYPGLDLFGARGTPIGKNKAVAFRDYRFSIVVEPFDSRNRFTEHLLDCLMFGTVPIYWGCPNIAEYFDPAGLIGFHNLAQLDFVLERLSHDPEKIYLSALGAVRRNFELAQKYEVVEDWQYWNIYAPWLAREGEA